MSFQLLQACGTHKRRGLLLNTTLMMPLDQCWLDICRLLHVGDHRNFEQTTPSEFALHEHGPLYIAVLAGRGVGAIALVIADTLDNNPHSATLTAQQMTSTAAMFKGDSPQQSNCAANLHLSMPQALSVP
jgi:hypothetical protein